jgi:hypothetical protein
MRSVSNIPVAVTDKGVWQLDEIGILRDAQEVSGIKLTWMHLGRARRWQKAPVLAVFRQGEEWNWCVAEVARAACESCGVEAGTQWINDRNTPSQVWVCKTCIDAMNA